MKNSFFNQLVFSFLILWVSPVLAKYSPQDSIEIRQETTIAYDFAFNDPETGLIKADEIIEKCKSLEYPFGEAHAYIFKADCYLSKGDYARTIYNLLIARNICIDNGVTGLEQRLNRPFGELYLQLGEPRKAVNHHLNAIKLSTEVTETAISTKGLSDAYYETGQLDSAMYYAEPLFAQAGTAWSAIGISLGKIYTALGRYDEALVVYQTKAGLTYDLDLVDNYLGRAIIFDSLGMIDSSRYYGTKSLELAQDRSFYRFINKASALLASTYKNTDKDTYLKYLLTSYSAKDSLYSREKMNQINNYIFADETRQRDVAATELRFANQKRTLSLIGLSAILLISGLLLWRNNYIKSKSNNTLRVQKEKIESTLEQLKATQDQLINAEKTAKELEIKEANRLRELDQLKTRLYTNITHEFRTPLTVIMGMNDNIKGHRNERSLIKRNAKNLLRLINQLLDLSKLDSGSLQVNLVQGDIISYLQYLTESFYSMATDKRVTLSYRATEQSLYMDFDEDKIQHIVYNLLSNAIKYTRPGGKVLLETQQILIETESTLKIMVKDTGVGIPKSDLPHIFDRFFQVDDHKSLTSDEQKTFSGTGIGLAFAKELVELMDGQIDVHSEIGWGTSFTILLPIRKNEQTIASDFSNTSQEIKNDFSPTLENIPATPDQIPGGKPHILIVEDNAGVTAYIKSLLEDNYQVQIAINGQEGIDMALEHIPDLIISDVMMPEKNGYEVCNTLKNDTRSSHIPIILLTAKADFNSKIEGLEKGADAYLAKPFEKQELLVRVRKLLEVRKALHAHYHNGLGVLNPRLTPGNLEDQFLTDLTKVIEDRIGDAALTVPEISTAVQLSHTQLYRKLKAITGKTPSQFVRTIRLQKAKQLLIHSNYNVSEVAYEVGFSDPSYFSRMFKREFGNTPGELNEYIK